MQAESVILSVITRPREAEADGSRTEQNLWESSLRAQEASFNDTKRISHRN